MYYYAGDLTKTEKELGRVRERITQLGEDMENCLRLARQKNQNHEEEVYGLRKYMNVLENEMGRQVEDFRAEREHCYILLN